MSKSAPPNRGKKKAATEGVSSFARALYRHALVGALAVVLALGFYNSRIEWDAEMRLWRALGDAGFALLAMALVAGPLATLWPRFRPLVTWRRSFGVWFAVVALVHAYLVWDGWARWDLSRLFGYEDLSSAGVPEPVMTDPGFGLANLIGIVALVWGLVIAAVSSDAAMRGLGGRAWKHVQQYAYVVFYLVGVHGAYFLFMHYELSLRTIVFQKSVPAPNWFRFWFVAVLGIVAALQFAAFIATTRKHKRTAPAAPDASLPP